MKINKNSLLTLLVLLVLAVQLANPLRVYADGDPPAVDTTEETPPPETPEPDDSEDAASPEPEIALDEEDVPVPQDVTDETEASTLGEDTEIEPLTGTAEPPESLPDLDGPVVVDENVEDTEGSALAMVDIPTEPVLPEITNPIEGTPEPGENSIVEEDLQVEATKGVEEQEPVPAKTALPTEESVAAESEVAPEPALDLNEANPEEIKEPALAGILSEIPEGTDLVVLDENGQIEPLVTQEAAETIMASDPMWCPDTSAPGGTGCTTSYTTMKDLLNTESGYINSQNVNGTIWITSGSVGDLAPIVINGLTYTNWANYSLTLQGGLTVDVLGDPIFDSNGKAVIGSNSIFSVPISITNWKNDVTVNNITIENYALGNGMNLRTTGDVLIKDSNFRGNGGQGVYVSEADNVSITRSTFENNDQYGVQIFNVQNNVTITDSILKENGQNGQAGLYLYQANDVTITGSTFNDNKSKGAAIHYPNNLTIANSTFSNNSDDGVYISKAAGNVMIGGSTISQNGSTGMDLMKANNVTLNNSTFTLNTNEGVHIGTAINDVMIDNSVFSHNGTAGTYLYQANNVTVNNSVFTDNSGKGAAIHFPNNLTITNSAFSNNGNAGAFISRVDNNLIVTDSTFNNNGYMGMLTYNPNNLTITGSIFDNNQNSGAYLRDANNVLIADSIFSRNYEGLYIYLASLATIRDSLFKDNQIGINANASGQQINLILDNVTFENNNQGFRSLGDVTLTEIISLETIEPTIIFNVPPGTVNLEIIMDCSLHKSYTAQWANNDRVQMSCQDNSIAHISLADNTTLPELPVGYQYVSAYSVGITRIGDVQPVPLIDGYIELSFMSKDTNPQYDILYWDEATGEWMILQAYQEDLNRNSVGFPIDPSNSDAIRKVLKGMQRIDTTNPPRVETTVNFTGLFVLAQR